MSAAPLNSRTNGSPRWSHARPDGLLPASIAGLHSTSACVLVGPPLTASGSNPGDAPSSVSAGNVTSTPAAPTRLLAPSTVAAPVSEHASRTSATPPAEAFPAIAELKATVELYDTNDA